MNTQARTATAASRMDIEHARFNMVEQQIRPWEVLDASVLNLLLRVHREDFVPEQHYALAFVDMEIPLGHGEVMLSPKLEARMLQEVAVQRSDAILEIGTGSGYLTALLARLAREVVSIEIHDDFVASASTRLGKLGYGNVRLEVGDGLNGWSTGAPWPASSGAW